MQFKVRMDAWHRCPSTQEEPDWLLTRLKQGAVALKSELCWHSWCWRLWELQPVETDLSLTSHSSMAVSYAAPKASREASLA